MGRIVSKLEVSCVIDTFKLSMMTYNILFLLFKTAPMAFIIH